MPDSLIPLPPAMKATVCRPQTLLSSRTSTRAQNVAGTDLELVGLVRKLGDGTFDSEIVSGLQPGRKAGRENGL